MLWTRAELEADGFEGFVPFSQLSGVPDLRGVYVVIRTDSQAPTFTATSPAKRKKGKLGAVSLAALRSRWIDDSTVVYIGKAGGTGIASTLKTRLEDFRATGVGTSTKHRGGRYIWQLAGSNRLLVGWKVVLDEEPVAVEGRMIRQFRSDHGGSRPFANVIG
jgi:hypothetical protein